MIFKLFSSLLLFWYLTDGLEKMCVYVHTESSPVFNESSLLSWCKLIVNTISPYGNMHIIKHLSDLQ